ncbi:YitT family protein [Alicyclobacillus sendaiensis]|uniref:YitT family protein n=1 Tax=Alicyclobacillus sendaiensis PA2 TaxID=3029425 RepID=A0ABT6Y0V9_ALISE|nr:YitT family protein [Alicyclobacillus sendaiensis]MDI9260887.1 YitT family protein [Alicyclobacillus sendaiensis PA2]
MRVYDDVRRMVGMRGASHPALDWTWRIAVILFSDLVGAVAVNNFLTPAHILAGGVTGVAQILHHYVPELGVGTMYFVFNIPLFILGYRYLGRRFIFQTGIAILGFSALADFVRLHFSTPTDPLLMGLYGGVLTGLSSGLVIRVGGSMGGTDIVSLVVHRLTGRNIGSVSFVMNAAIVLLSMLVFGVPAGLYTLVSMYAASRVVSGLMHFQQRKTALIVTSKPSEVASAIGQRLVRGSTVMRAYGAYTQRERGVLLCAMTHLEIADLKEIVQSLDPDAFITILDTTEVIGRFRQSAP